MKHRKTTRLKAMIQSPELSFLLEAHNGLSAKLVQEAGFEGIWASGLSMAASLGVRDNNEASWTQVLDMLEFMSDASDLPILHDGDTGYGNFNTMRRLVRKLEQIGVAGVCIEDKLFPKTNSFLRGTAQPLADIDEFAGKIKAGKDAQSDPDFVIVARTEAFIAGWGLGEALARAEAYRQAGADAILIHSAQATAAEVLAFKREWGDRLPVVIVPTKYYATPTDVFRENGFSVVIWANHMMRASLAAMRETARQLRADQHLLHLEDRLPSVVEVFRLQGEDELEAAEKRYLPGHGAQARAIVLAASRGSELGALTAESPKCMVPVGDRPLLAHIADTYRAAGVKRITAVRGYGKDKVDLPGLAYVDNDEHAHTQEVYSLYQAREALEGECLISYGDVLFRKFILHALQEIEADFVVAVDAHWRESRNRGRAADYVRCSEPSSRTSFYHAVSLEDFVEEGDGSGVHGEWMGFLRASAAGARLLRDRLDALAADPARLRAMKMPDLLRLLIAEGRTVRVVYTAGHWLDIDSLDDVLTAAAFGGPVAERVVPAAREEEKV